MARLTSDQQMKALIKHLEAAGYQRDELRCQWIRGNHVLSDEALIFLASDDIPRAAVDAAQEVAGWPG